MDQADAEVAEGECDEGDSCSDEESDHLSVDMAGIQAAEKRPAPTTHEDAVKRLRGPGRPPKRAYQQPAPTSVPQRATATSSPAGAAPGLVDVPLRGASAPALPVRRAPAKALINPYRHATSSSRQLQPRQKGLDKVLEGQVDVPVSLLAGLVLHASGSPEQLARSWVARAVSDAKELGRGQPGENNTLEIAQMGGVTVEQLQVPPAVLNPVTAAMRSS